MKEKKKKMKMKMNLPGNEDRDCSDFRRKPSGENVEREIKKLP